MQSGTVVIDDVAGRFAGGWQERLHDGPLQTAIALHFVARQDPRLDHLAGELASLVDELRDVLAQRPANQTGSTFVDAVHALAAGCIWARVEVDVRLGAREPGREARTMALRFVSEALANLRHADAHSAQLRVEADGRKLRITLSDDGQGFDVAAALVPRAGHLGLVDLRQAVAEAGGRLRIRTVPGAGSMLSGEFSDAFDTAHALAGDRLTA